MKANKVNLVKIGRIFTLAGVAHFSLTMINAFLILYRTAFNIDITIVFLIVCTFIKLSAANSLCKPLNVSMMIVPLISSLLTNLPLLDAKNTVLDDKVRWWNLLGCDGS